MLTTGAGAGEGAGGLDLGTGLAACGGRGRGGFGVDGLTLTCSPEGGEMDTFGRGVEGLDLVGDRGDLRSLRDPGDLEMSEAREQSTVSDVAEFLAEVDAEGPSLASASKNLGSTEEGVERLESSLRKRPKLILPRLVLPPGEAREKKLLAGLTRDANGAVGLGRPSSTSNNF